MNYTINRRREYSEKEVCGPLDKANFESWAARQQEHADDNDDRLWNATESKHPLCQWWWGRRIVGYKTGAFCYLCNKLVVTWDGKYPMPVKAKKEIMKHRQFHIDGTKKGE